MSTHDLHDEGSLMGAGSRDDVIYSRNDSVEGRVSSDGHVSTTEVVINGSDHTDDVEVGVAHDLVIVDEIPMFQFLEEVCGRNKSESKKGLW